MLCYPPVYAGENTVSYFKKDLFVDWHFFLCYSNLNVLPLSILLFYHNFYFYHQPTDIFCGVCLL